jgi:hypothetical protein
MGPRNSKPGLQDVALHRPPTGVLLQLHMARRMPLGLPVQSAGRLQDMRFLARLAWSMSGDAKRILYAYCMSCSSWQTPSLQAGGSTSMSVPCSCCGSQTHQCGLPAQQLPPPFSHCHWPAVHLAYSNADEGVKPGLQPAAMQLLLWGVVSKHSHTALGSSEGSGSPLQSAQQNHSSSSSSSSSSNSSDDLLQCCASAAA